VVSGGADSVGGLVGSNQGNIDTSHVSDTSVTGATAQVGGLAGWNGGSITNSYVNFGSRGYALGATDVGGLVGVNDYGGSISDCSVSGGWVSGYSNYDGLVGWNAGSVSNSFVFGTLAILRTDVTPAATQEVVSALATAGDQSTISILLQDIQQNDQVSDQTSGGDAGQFGSSNSESQTGNDNAKTTKDSDKSNSAGKQKKAKKKQVQCLKQMT
jgi:hypothetical protein